MEQLAEAISNAGTSPSELRDAAKKFAAHAIDTYRDGLLEKAISVSVAIANFLNEMESPK